MKISKLTITLDDYTLDMINKWVTTRAMTKSQLIRLAVEEYIKNHTYPGNPVVYGSHL